MAEPSSERLELLARRLCEGLSINADALMLRPGYTPYNLPHGLGVLYAPDTAACPTWQGLLPFARVVDAMFPDQEPA